MTAAVPLPMFPLGTVLFPYAQVSLHVFEPRYRALVRDCMRTGLEFGVVLIERGPEVGGGDSRFGLGTVAHITEASPFPDGRWLLVATGTRRIRVTAWLPDDPYPLALVEDVPERFLSERALHPVQEAARLVRRALVLKGELGEPAAPPSFELHREPHVAAYQLAGLSPLGPVDQQRLLEVDDPDERLRLLTTLVTEAGDLLAYRLSAG